MSTYEERVDRQEKMDRAVKRATAYLRSAEQRLYASQHVRGYISSWYYNLLEQALDTAAVIVRYLPADYFQDNDVPDYFGILGGASYKHNLSDDLLEKAKAVVAEIERRRERADVLRRIAALENVTGRTSEEAAAYRAKAAELRRGLD